MIGSALKHASRYSGYRKDGSVHREGVQNEKRMVEYLQSHTPDCFGLAYPGVGLRFSHHGGTHDSSDIDMFDGDVKLAGISVKQNKGGTFDHKNTSRVLDFLPAASLVEFVQSLRTDFFKKPGSVDYVRVELNKKINETLETMESNQIRALLQRIYGSNPDWMLIAEKTHTTVFRNSDMEELSKYPNDPDTTYELRCARSAKTSRQIWRITNGVEVNTDLRLRLTLNNGVNALLGLSEKNKNSIMTIKIQQDNVQKLLKGISTKTVLPA